MENLLEEVRQLQELRSAVAQDCAEELGQVKSMVSFESTLDRQRKVIGQTSLALEKTIEASMANTSIWGSSLHGLMRQVDAPTRLLVEVVDGKVGQVRLAQAAT